MSKNTPISSPSPPSRSASRHQSPSLRTHLIETSMHHKSSDIGCDSPTDFHSLTTKTNYADDGSFSTSTPTIDIDAENISDRITANTMHQQFCLRWNNYGRNLTSVFDQLLQNESFVDVTLACDGHSIKAHKMVLSACSPYFQSLFFDNPCQHPIIIMRDVKWSELKAIVEFMYKGEIKVSQAEIGPLLRVAEMLKIRGLTDVNGDQEMSSMPKRRLSHSSQQQSDSSSDNKKSRTNKRLSSEWDDNQSAHSPPIDKQRKTKRSTPVNDQRSSDSPRMSNTPTPELTPTTNFSINATAAHATTTKHRNNVSPLGRHSANLNTPIFPISTQSPVDPISLSTLSTTDDLEIKPGIAEMIREEERAKILENSQAWPGVAQPNSLAESYQYQLQSMWQKCWSTNQNLVHHLRFRERGPLKSWRPETMAEAIFSVLKDGLSLSQAARKYDIPYPTFVLYANRVHNMLGPSIDSGLDLRPKGRGRPQRILLGIWPDDHIKSVIKAVVFRDAKDLKEDPLHLAAAAAAAAAYGRHSPVYPFHDGAIPGFQAAANGLMPNANANDSISSEAAVAMAAVMNLRQQQLNAANQHQSDSDMPSFNLPSPQMRSESGGVGCLKQPKLGSPATSSQPNNTDNFPMPRLASPAILPNIHSLSGLSGLHLMQQHNLGGNSDLLSTRTRTRSNDTKTPPHTEISKYGNTDRNEKPLRHINASDQLKSLSSKSNTANNNNNNNNNINSKESSGQLNSPSNEKQISFDDFDSVGVDIAINGLPFKSTLQGFLASAAANEEQPLFGDELADFDEPDNGNGANSRDKIKVEPLTESVRGV